ncbi:hypothetical protein VCO01S_31440 [Vibrio comitans NBRC 102076]|uniref:Response regulatory domain-containing protein n=2 Tax=Vibrio comitans TaxID=413401 RepID=A0A4Y3IQY1_9VIBR|nr:hypothetical protein VCO01S_31440 [Vibrio comitans NBRC 102076]
MVLLALSKSKQVSKYEEELKVSNFQSQLVEIIEHNNDAIVITDRHGSITWINKAFTDINGISFDKSVGEKLINTLQRKLADSDSVERINKAITNAESIEVDVLNYHKDGCAYWLEISLLPIFQSGEIDRFIVVEKDITSRKLLELRLTKSAEVAREETDNKSHFLTLLIDELKAPLQRLNNVSAKLTEKGKDKETNEIFSEIKVCSNYIDNTILSIETLENIDLNNFKVYNSSFSLSNIVEDLRKVCVQSAKEKNLNLDFTNKLSNNTIYFGDGLLIKSIFSFYISSVINKLSNCEVRISVSDTLKNETGIINLSVHVLDEGEIYHILHDRVSDGNLDVSNLSMGRSFVYQRVNDVINKLDGHLVHDLDSSGSSRISLCVPLELDISSFNSYPVEASQRILVAEDNRVNSIVLTKMLRSIGFSEIDIAKNGAEAVEMAREKRYYAILMDNHMPVMNGIEASRVIKDTVDKESNIIACTADSSKVAVEQFRSSGVEKIIFKPINKAKILEHLQHTDSSFRVIKKIS